MAEEQNIVETQLILGKQVLEIVFDLLKSDSKTGVILPLLRILKMMLKNFQV